MRQARLFVAGEWTDGTTTSDVLDKYTGEPIAVLHHASREQVERATTAVTDAQENALPPAHERARILALAAQLLAERKAAVAETIVAEAGFTVGDTAREIDRAVQTLTLCAEEAGRIHGQMVPLDSSPAGAGRLAFTIRRPVGVVCAITPFNSPLNTVLHKVGPAIAAGNGVVLKPATYTPMTSEHIVEILLDAGLPPNLIALLNGGGSNVGAWLLEDPRPSFYAFTGSTEVGERIRGTVGLRRSQLEMGSLSSTIVCADAGVPRAVGRCLEGAFRKSGQICTSVQRLYLQDGIYDEFADALVAALAGRNGGDPKDEKSFIGPLISLGDAERVASWIESAGDAGAKILTGGTRTDRVVQPTVLADVPPAADVMCREVFGPVVSLRRFSDVDDAVSEANDTPYGLALGIFTDSLETALATAERMRVGSVHVNETSNSRLDVMPYTGLKASGMGREGPRYAIEEMTEETLVTFSRRP
ncbi:MAG: aldehyde dehydrogenase family protein [Acidothermales bacterium]|nr:aldehyde dehydrogenase family protein [Acidothermales bacterium]